MAEVLDEIWVTKDGTPMLVGAMEEEHVRNVLRMILRERRHKAERMASYAAQAAEAQRSARQRIDLRSLFRHRALDDERYAATAAFDDPYFNGVAG